MKVKKLITLTLVGLLGICFFVTPASATNSKPPGTPQLDKQSEDWREDYAYHLGVQAYIFSLPWAFLPHIRYAWVVENEPKKRCDPLYGAQPLVAW